MKLTLEDIVYHLVDFASEKEIVDAIKMLSNNLHEGKSFLKLKKYFETSWEDEFADANYIKNKH